MSISYAVLLALIQALTEFLPVSSSGHLGLAGFFFDMPYQGLTFDLALHFGTLFAVVIYFWRDLFAIGRDTFALLPQGKLVAAFRDPDAVAPTQRLGIGIALATIPAALVGAAMPDSFTESLRTPLLIAINLIFWGVLMWLADARGERSRPLDGVRYRDAILIGVAQAFALIPGTSRSGVTMTMGLALGLTRDAAARYSFLMSAPIVFLASIHGAYEFSKGGESIDPAVLAIGVAVSAIAGVGVIHFLLAVLRRVGTAPFALYRIALGLVVIGMLWQRGTP